MFQSVQRHPSLPDVVAKSLTEAILTARFVPGERLPSERELGEQFGVSRTVIREAVRSLAARGLVSVTSGRCVTVTAVTGETVSRSLQLFIRGQASFDYGKIHEVRCVTEVETAGLAADRAVAEDLQRLEALCNALAQQLDAGNLLAAADLDFQFHRALMTVAGNELFLIMFDSISDILLEIRDKSYSQQDVGPGALKAHQTILSSVARGDGASSRNAMLAHLVEAKFIWLAQPI